MLVASDPTCKPASSVLERSNTRTTSYHSWEDGGIGLILRVRYVSVDKGAITKERLTFVKVQPVFPASVLWKMSGGHCSPLDIAKSDTAMNVKMSRRIGLREWQKSGLWVESRELFSRESRDVLSVRCRENLLVEHASSTVDYLWNVAYTIYILFFFFETGNRCNISWTLIGCHKKNIQYIRLLYKFNYKFKLSFNIYIYNS